MARNTLYTLYKTGRTDPSFRNIWAFENDVLRNAWLDSCSPRDFSNNKYWRTGSTIKCPIRYEESFNYDYVRIINRLGEPQATKTWFCFITGRTYISNNCTLFTLSVDYPQTFLFNEDGKPFWKTYGFIQTATIENPAANRGQGAEYPIPARQCASIWYDALKDFSIIAYSTVDLTVLATTGTVAYNPQVNDGVYMASVPFVVTGPLATDVLKTTIEKLNELGLTEAVSGIFCAPSRYFSRFTADTWTMCAQSNIDTETITVNTITSIGTYTPVNKVLLRGDYSVIVVNNGQGESSLYHYEDFIGTPTFKTTISVVSGFPCVMLWPGDNYKYGNANDFRQYIIKITSPITCSYLNDNYKIWLAQNANQRAAALNSAQVEIDNANRASQYVLSSNINDLVNNFLSKTTGQSSQEYILSFLRDNPNYFYEAADKFEANDAKARTLSRQLSGGKYEYTGPTRSGISAAITRGMGDIVQGARDSLTRAAVNAPQNGPETILKDFAGAYLKRELGIEHAYVYDNAIATAQANLQKVQAFYADKEVIPSTSLGSNAHGDLVLFNQFNFMISVITPTVEWAVKIDKLLSSSGCLVNNLGEIYRRHSVFDFYKCESPWIMPERNGRPQYVRNMLIHMLQDGVYLWYYNNGDISEYIGLPYDISNPAL